MKTSLPPPAKKVPLKKGTRRLIAKRREWRQRACTAAIEFATYPAGKPERGKVESELGKCLNKVRAWFRGDRANLVINAIQRRAVNAYRAAN
jgi:hypothetical protein